MELRPARRAGDSIGVDNRWFGDPVLCCGGFQRWCLDEDGGYGGPVTLEGWDFRSVDLDCSLLVEATGRLFPVCLGDGTVD